LSPRSRLTKAAGGTKARSKRSRGVTRLRRGSCGKTFSNTSRNSSCFLPGIINPASRRSMKLFDVVFTSSPSPLRSLRRNGEDLAERLRTEWPGILAWAIAGCLEWQEHGLAPPEAVTAATGSYLEAEDVIAAWIDERCQRRPNAWERSSVLFASWKDWADKAGEAAGTMKRFVQCLENRGFRWRRQATGRGFEGLALLPPVRGGQ
jgi:phage/plasmid-associated DNA primase